MRDAAYFLTAILFFALMLAYVAWCARLGGNEAGEGDRP
jgi:hypothetical protein